MWSYKLNREACCTRESHGINLNNRVPNFACNKIVTTYNSVFIEICNCIAKFGLCRNLSYVVVCLSSTSVDCNETAL